MARDYEVMSHFGYRCFLLPYTNSETVPDKATTADEIDGILNASIGGIHKEIKKYVTLNGNGYPSSATLGNTLDDGTFECVREGQGDAYTGTAGDTTYTRIKDWFMKATKDAGKSSPRCLIEVIPRGDELESTCYFVKPQDWGPGAHDTESGQEYSFTVSTFGPPVPVTVTYTNTEGVESWAFAKVETQ